MHQHGPRNEPGLTAGQPHQARLTQWRLAFPVQLGGLPGLPLRIVALPRKKTKPVMWAGRLGWPLHPCPCRPALQKLQPKIAFRFRPHVAACRRTADRAPAADLHACAEPFYDSAWLSNSSSPGLSAGEWDKPPLPAHSPIFLSNLPLLRHV